jgi:FkbM family methyltransferase
MVNHPKDDIAAASIAESHGNVTARIADHTFLPAFLGPASIVFDLGANRGQFTRAIVTAFGCQVHAVEPNPHLSASLERLAMPGVTVYAAALSGSPGSLPFVMTTNSEASHFSGSSGPGEDTVQVEALTLADLMSRVPAQARIDLVKMDIEGAELDVLEGAPKELLERVSQFTIEFHQFVHPESRPRVERIKQRFRNLGFWVVDFTRCNYDVLCVHPDVPLSFGERASVVIEKNQLQIRRYLSRWLPEPAQLSR